MAKSKLLVIPADEENELERVQTGIRMEKRLMKVLRATADYKDLPLGGLLENIVLYSFGDLPCPFTQADLERIRQLKDVYYDEGEHRGSPESRLFNHIIRVAVAKSVREIQLEPQQDGFIHVLYRIGDKLTDWIRVPAQKSLEPLVKYVETAVSVNSNGSKTSYNGSTQIQMPDDSKFILDVNISNGEIGKKIIFKLKAI